MADINVRDLREWISKRLGLPEKEWRAGKLEGPGKGDKELGFYRELIYRFKLDGRTADLTSEELQDWVNEELDKYIAACRGSKNRAAREYGRLALRFFHDLLRSFNLKRMPNYY